MTVKFSIKGTQHVEAALKKQLAQYRKAPKATIGVHEDTGIHAKSGLTNAKIGATNHFGDDNIPPRPFLDVGFEQGLDRYAKDFASTIERGESVDTALERVAILGVGEIQKYMTDLRTPPNAPLTIAKKGSDNPLIDTGELRASINYKFTQGTLKEGFNG